MATTSVPITADAWADCGSTPCFVQNLSVNPVRFVIDTAAPASLAATGHVLSTDGSPTADVGLSGQRLYARVHRDGGASANLVVSR